MGRRAYHRRVTQPSAELNVLWAALMLELRVELGPQDGLAAFERHQLLAIRFTRVARLNAPASVKDREGQMWQLFFEEHFPRGGERAKLLWNDWRTRLLKDDAPGPGIAVTHGHPEIHWHTDQGRLGVNLETMWDDYELAIDHFIHACAGDAELKARALKRWKERLWSVQTFNAPGTPVASAIAVSASMSSTGVGPSASCDRPLT